MTRIRVTHKSQKRDEMTAASGSSIETRAQLFDVSQDEHGGLMIALFPPPEVASKISSLKGVETPPEQLHITLCYVGGIDELDDADVAAAILKTKNIAKNFGPIEAKVNGIGRFNAPDTDAGTDAKDVCYAVIDSPQLDDLRGKLVSALQSAGIKQQSDHGFNPHMTLAYIPRGAKLPVTKIETIPLTMDEITVCVGDKRRSYKFTGKHMLPKPVEQLLKFYNVLRSVFDNTVISRDMALTQVGQQIWVMLDKRNMESPEDEMNYHYLQDMYVGNGGDFYAVTISGGKLFKWRVEIDAQSNVVDLGVPTMVKLQFTQTVNGQTRVSKREDGRFQAFSVLSTALLNKDNQIDSRALYDSFCERFAGDGREYINIYHLGHDATRVGELLSIFREENLLVGYYVLDDNLVANRIAETLMADREGRWGGSIEFFSDDEPELIQVADGVTAGVFTKGTLLGYSLAKAVHGAAWGTEHLVRENMDERNKAQVLELLGNDEGALGVVEQWLDARNERIRESGAITRTTGEEVEQLDAEEVEQVVEDAGEVERVVELDEETVGMIVDAVLQSEWMTGFHQAFMALEARVDAIDGMVAEEAQPVEDGQSAEELAQNIQQLQEEVAGVNEELTRLRALFGASRPAAQPQRERVVLKKVGGNQPDSAKTPASAPQARTQVNAVSVSNTGGVPQWRPTGLIKSK